MINCHQIKSLNSPNSQLQNKHCKNNTTSATSNDRIRTQICQTLIYREVKNTNQTQTLGALKNSQETNETPLFQSK
ncbi:hypothetical protein OIU79_013491 [Salix purpurea]|uniref:Uncharacterized protein n=1 Tax=Salix purpurea TaxID=77065 RepID=A0A9Q0PNI4_SALPP|nr:hypothetical protein OIU79_013491 [Salix purpurea]